MAKRPVFLPSQGDQLVQAELVEFRWFPGHALAQKQRSIASLHEEARDALGIEKILEVSTKSTNRLGVALSAFNLQLTSERLGRTMSVEAAFQGSKVFADSGQHEEIYSVEDGGEIKRLMRRHADETIQSFRFEDDEWPTEPKTGFYDWLYVRALREQLASLDDSDVADQLLATEGFTDIEFNPTKSINCQAHSCALYLALHHRGLTGTINDPVAFLAVIRGKPADAEAAAPQRLFED